jgi:hypothetical protein
MVEPVSGSVVAIPKGDGSVEWWELTDSWHLLRTEPSLESLASDTELLAAIAGLELLPGPKGDVGPAGPQGEQGLPGADGAQGIPGNDGAPGAKGDTGDQGIQGVQGVPGETGAKGDTGDVGPAGEQGPQGIQGIQGIQGETGSQGSAGSNGTNGFPQILVTMFMSGALVAWTNMPAALTEFLGLTTTRTKIDLTSATQSRVIVRNGVAPVANAKIKVQYSTDGTNFSDLCSVTMPATANNTNVGSWTAVPEGAKADTFLRVVGIDGNGVADPSFGLITLGVK